MGVGSWREVRTRLGRPGWRRGRWQTAGSALRGAGDEPYETVMTHLTPITSRAWMPRAIATRSEPHDSLSCTVGRPHRACQGILVPDRGAMTTHQLSRSYPFSSTTPPASMTSSSSSPSLYR